MAADGRHAVKRARCSNTYHVAQDAATHDAPEPSIRREQPPHFPHRTNRLTDVKLLRFTRAMHPDRPCPVSRVRTRSGLAGTGLGITTDRSMRPVLRS